jgi:pilus assembly protein CpaB
MDVKKIALLVGALLVAAVTAIMAKNMFTGASAPSAEAAAVPAGPKILVSRKALPVGTIVDAESFTYQPWPKDLVQNAYYQEGQPDSNMQSLLGTVVRQPITAGQPLTRGSLVGPNDRGFLAAALGPGMRAVTVPVSTIGGVAGFVFPGDRVDVVLTQEVTGGGEGPPLKVSETVIRNIRVLATDQRTDTKGEDGKPVVKTFNNVTMEATPRIAEKIAVAQTLGTLSLSLRSLSDTTVELERAVAAGDIKLPKGVSPAEERRMLLAVANQPLDTASTYSTGGDVSRFQRRTVPARPAPPPSAPPVRVEAPVTVASNASGEARSAGPMVRVSRGNNVSYVPVGAR